MTTVTRLGGGADANTSGKRKRKSKSDADIRRSMRHSGIKVLIARGFANMSIDDVARHAGVPLRTALRVVPTSLELVKVIIQDRLDEFLSLVAVSVNGPDQQSTLERILTECAQFVLDEGVIALNRIVIFERGSHPEIAELFYAEGVERVPVTLAAWLSLQRDLGAIALDDCDAAARLLVGMVTADIQRGALLGRALPSAAELGARAGLCATLFLNGCAVRH